MKDGTISNNNSGTAAGGVFIATKGIFIMEGGTIYGNSATTTGGGVYLDGVAGVCGLTHYWLSAPCGADKRR